MSELENENQILDQEGQELTPETPEEWRLSQEEWKNFQEDQKKLSGMISSLFEPETDDLDLGRRGDPDDIDLSDPRQLAELVGAVVDHRLNSITPYVKTAAQDQGKRVMKEMFSGLEGDLKKEFPAGFDHSLAERTAFYFFDQTGDAEKSVKEAARYAAEMRKSDREAALEETRSKATRAGRGASDEPGAGSSAVPGRPPAKDYDEVIERYAHQTEV